VLTRHKDETGAWISLLDHTQQRPRAQDAPEPGKLCDADGLDLSLAYLVTAPEPEAKRAGGEIQEEDEESADHSVQFDLGFGLHRLKEPGRNYST
jgi:hypothetical protein